MKLICEAQRFYIEADTNTEEDRLIRIAATGGCVEVIRSHSAEASREPPASVCSTKEHSE